jgi:uncharacterized protein YjdB
MTRLRFWALSIGLVLAACSSDDLVTPLPSLASIDVRLANATIAAGSTTQAFATLRDSTGRTFVVTGDTVVWTSSNTDIATIDPKTGIVSAVAPGSSAITAAF